MNIPPDSIAGSGVSPMNQPLSEKSWTPPLKMPTEPAAAEPREDSPELAKQAPSGSPLEKVFGFASSDTPAMTAARIALAVSQGGFSK